MCNQGGRESNPVRSTGALEEVLEFAVDHRFTPIFINQTLSQDKQLTHQANLTNLRHAPTKNGTSDRQHLKYPLKV
ncbi:hypothetical protein BofuT4_uP086710.1 [Botrytis cinerea T4]|uniref:Uncharacterized protein n=1 Tax=Botryotinia fuckeliana (strain T4) TaxID=999810 RepID=G2YGJ4_BOTF4|nr:hypothetical protein BofuT4_uP086710.1 [Botrytis cinerea T4]